MVDVYAICPFNRLSPKYSLIMQDIIAEIARILGAAHYFDLNLTPDKAQDLNDFLQMLATEGDERIRKWMLNSLQDRALARQLRNFAKLKRDGIQVVYSSIGDGFEEEFLTRTLGYKLAPLVARLQNVGGIESGIGFIWQMNDNLLPRGTKIEEVKGLMASSLARDLRYNGGGQSIILATPRYPNVFGSDFLGKLKEESYGDLGVYDAFFGPLREGPTLISRYPPEINERLEVGMDNLGVRMRVAYPGTDRQISSP